MASASGDEHGRLRDAVRLLFLLNAIGQAPGPDAPDSAVTVVRSQMRLQACDFWLRNPDYLAHELLNDIRDGRRPPADLAVVDKVLAGDEPDLRRAEMIRWRFGAYEPLDDAFAVLKTSGYLLRRAKGKPTQVNMHLYFLTAAGREATGLLVREAPMLTWYADRAKIVAELAGSTGGDALKARQHALFEYHDTKMGEHISSILPQVRDRLERMKAGDDGQA